MVIVDGDTFGVRPTSSQVPTLMWQSLPHCASAPAVACVKTTPGRGPLFPVVNWKGVSFGKCDRREMTVSCNSTIAKEELNSYFRL